MQLLLSIVGAGALLLGWGVAHAEQTVEGVVQSIGSTTITVLTERGRMVTIDTTRVPQRDVAVGRKVKITGDGTADTGIKARSLSVTAERPRGPEQTPNTRQPQTKEDCRDFSRYGFRHAGECVASLSRPR